ncbi:MAG: efflux RND transporter periplasmic adaptor subunit [Hyphomicrobiaceae bacterium]
MKPGPRLTIAAVTETPVATAEGTATSTQVAEPAAALGMTTALRRAEHWIQPVAAALWVRKWTVIAALLALLLAIYTIPGAVFGPKITGEPAVRGLFLQTVVASGHVEAPFRVNIASQITAVVAKVPVVEGQKVTAGHTLIELDDRELRAVVTQAEGLVAQAAARVRQMVEATHPAAEQALKQAQATLTNAQNNFERTTKLSRDGYATRVALDEATRALDVAKAQVKSAEFHVSTMQMGGSDYVMAETQLTQAKASLASAQSRLSYTVIKAPRDGVLISRNVEAGNTVVPGAALMVLSPDGEIQLVVQIDEKNLSLIAIGQKALGSADAYAKDTFPAEVFYVNPGIDLQRASVEVKLRVPKPPDYLRQDMTISADIEVARREHAVTISAGNVRGLNGAKPWVLKADGGRAKRQDVKLGIVSGGRAEVLSGLEADDLVIAVSNTKLKPGQPVRVSAEAVIAP